MIRGALVLGSAHHACSRTFGGSGIGLTIAQSLAQAMGDEIRVESAGLGQGSSFTFTLPQAHE